MIVLQANGKHFSAGHDIKAVGNSDGTPQKWTLSDIYTIEARASLPSQAIMQFLL